MSFWPAVYSALDFELPPELIATAPADPADSARLLIVDRAQKSITHDRFYNLDKYLSTGDAVFYNATRVEERRVYLARESAESSESAVVFESVFLKQVSAKKWQVLMRNSRRLKDDAHLVALKDARYTFTLEREGGQNFLASSQPLAATDFARIGEMPIPPYMRRAATEHDNAAYQNFFSEEIAQKEKIQGSAASPTAALHFTAALYDKLRAGRIEFYPVCLDIGYGTFAPLTAENFVSDTLHAEHYFIPSATVEKLGSARRKIALGTTALRALLSRQHYDVNEGETTIFVKPGDTIVGVEGLITNFHLPQSSLLLLVGAFCEPTLLMRAYTEAIQMRYRFYSYGDAMLII